MMARAPRDTFRMQVCGMLPVLGTFGGAAAGVKRVGLLTTIIITVIDTHRAIAVFAVTSYSYSRGFRQLEFSAVHHDHGKVWSR